MYIRNDMQKKKNTAMPSVLYLQRRGNAFYTNMHGTSPKKGQTKVAPLRPCRMRRSKNAETKKKNRYMPDIQMRGILPPPPNLLFLFRFLFLFPSLLQLSQLPLHLLNRMQQNPRQTHPPLLHPPIRPRPTIRLLLLPPPLLTNRPIQPPPIQIPRKP